MAHKQLALLFHNVDGGTGAAGEVKRGTSVQARHLADDVFLARRPRAGEGGRQTGPERHHCRQHASAH